jgi:RNA polymerase sigma-70 factor (ECF subfamily)
MDQQAAQSLVDDLLPRLRRLAAALKGRGPAADDLVARSWEQSLAALDEFDGQSRFDLWVVRRLIRLFLADQGEEPLGASEQLAKLQGLGDVRVSAEGLIAGMAQLAPVERAAVALACIEGLSYPEAAKCLGLSVKDFVQRLIAGRRALIIGLGGVEAVVGEEAA